MKFRKTRIMKATALCAAALLTGTSMLGAASPEAVLTQLAAEEAAASWTLDADGTLTISGDINDSECPWKDQAEQIKKVVFTKNAYFRFREAPFEGCVNLTTAVLAEDYSVRGAMFKGCTALTDVTIPEGVSNIGYNCFEGCTALKEIKLPESLTSISDEAFRGCTSLNHLSIPEKNYAIGAYAFADCTSLTDIESFGELSVTDRHIFENTPWLKAQQEKNPMVIVDNYLLDASACTGDVVIPDGVEKMAGAFADTDITSVQIPESLTYISKSGFRNCTGLTEVKLPERLNGLVSSAFEGCTGLTHIEIPDTVTVFGMDVFKGCTNLRSVKLPAQNDWLEDGVFEGCSSLESIEIPESVTKIGNSTFAGCAKLTEIIIPPYVRSIDSNAFKDCTSLESVTVKNPICDFRSDTFPDDLGTLIGYEGSSAQLAAEKLNIPFQSLGVFVDCPLNQYVLAAKRFDYLKPGETLEITEQTKDDLLCTGAKIAEAEVVVENLADLSLTQDELTTTIEEGSMYLLNSYSSFFYNNDKPVSIVHIHAKFTVQDTIKNREEELRFAFTKLVDEDGNDLLADMPDHKLVYSYPYHLYSPKPTTPTEPTTEPTEATTEPTEPVTEPTEPVTEPTEPVTDPTEPAAAKLGELNGDGIVNASDAAVILIAAASIGAGDASGLTEAQEAAADVNADGDINASDAANILIYAAAFGAGQTDATLEEYMKQQ